MKNSDVKVGDIVEMRVSGKLVAVRLEFERTTAVRLYSRSNMAPSYGERRVRCFTGVNLATGRTLPNPVKASRCRRVLRRLKVAPADPRTWGGAMLRAARKGQE